MTPTSAPPDDIDRRFTDYFRHELPEPFPSCHAMNVAVPSTRVQPRWTSPLHSRVTLAASVGLLFGLGLFLSSPGGRNRPTVKAPAGPGTNLLDTSTADGTELLKQAGK